MKHILRFTSYVLPSVPLAAGLVTGGFVARLALEWTARPWHWLLVLAIGILPASAGALIAWRLGPWPSPLSAEGRLWPLLLLSIYLFWPQRDFTIAAQLLILAALTTLLTWNRWQKFANLPIYQFADALTFTLALILYTATTAPDVLPADSGEFQIVAPLLGVAHPPGYPLYTLLGRLFTLLIPFGNAAYRLNLMSAFLAAGTLTLLGAATRHWARQVGSPKGAALVGGLTAALILGTATTFWAQAGIANIRTPTAFLAALCLYTLARYSQAVSHQSSAVGKTDRWLWLLALALGLGLGHHPSLAFIGVFFLVYVLLLEPRLLVQPRRWWRPAFFILLALLPLLYLPLRGAADATLAPPDLDTPGGFWHHVSAQGFEGDMFAFATAQDLPQRLALLPTLFRFQFNPVLLAAAVLGLLVLAWRDQRLLTLLGGGLILHTFVSITYRAPQTVEYLMPAYLPLSILTGLATAWLLSQQATPLRNTHYALRITHYALPLSAAIILLAALLNGLAHAPSFFTLARDRSTRAYVESILNQAPADALILADWRWATPLWYLQWVEGQRPDVEVQYVFPVPGQEEGDTWRERIAAVAGQRPLLLTHFYDLADYTLEPLGQGFLVHPRPHEATFAELLPLDALFSTGASQGGVSLLGYRLSREQVEPGQMLELTLAWQAVGALAASPSFSVQLIGQDGRRLAQADRYLGSAYSPGETRFERLVLPLYPEIPPGDYQLAVEVYSSGESGFETWPLGDGQLRLNLATLPLRAASEPPLTLHPLSVPFAGGPTLVGVDYDRSLPAALRLYLHWRGPAQGGEQVHVGEIVTHLPPLADGAYQTVVLDLPAATTGRSRLRLVDADGQVGLTAGPWGWPLREVRLPAPSPSARFVPLADEMALVGVTPGGEKTLSPGDPLTLRLTFVALKPLLQDNSVSVRLWDGAEGLRAMHDLQPALGTVPTLKWIRGVRVTDPHPLTVPTDLPAGGVRATLVVYERFRGTTLPTLDGRMGQVLLGEWQVTEQ